MTLLFGVTVLTFLLEYLTPGNAAETILGSSATPDTIAALSKQLGLNQPVYEQYWHWLSRVVHGDLGHSIISDVSVTSILNSRLPATISLIGGALVVAAIVGVLLGVISATRGGLLGKVVDAVSLFGLAIPSFWLGYLLVTIFAVHFHVFPAIGYVSISDSVPLWFKSLVLPVASLSVAGISVLSKQARDAMLDTMNQEFIRSLRARGISERSIIFKHALRSAMPNVVTLMGLFVVTLLLGATLVETVFAIPGIGSEVVQAATQHDLPVVEGAALYFTLIVVVVFVLVEVAAALLNPKLRRTR